MSGRYWLQLAETTERQQKQQQQTAAAAPGVTQKRRLQQQQQQQHQALPKNAVCSTHTHSLVPDGTLTLKKQKGGHADFATTCQDYFTGSPVFTKLLTASFQLFSSCAVNASASIPPAAFTAYVWTDGPHICRGRPLDLLPMGCRSCTPPGCTPPFAAARAIPALHAGKLYAGD